MISEADSFFDNFSQEHQSEEQEEHQPGTGGKEGG